MDLRQLKYFLRIAELGSMSRAADALHVAQSSLSRHLSNLESEFGQAMFYRTGRGVELTSAGVELAKYARAMLRLGDEARNSLTQNANASIANLSLGLSETLAHTLCIPLLNHVRAKYPKISLKLYDESSSALVDLLRDEILHMALIFDDQDLDGLCFRPVFEEELFLAVTTNHPLAQKKEVDIHELIAVPLVNFGESNRSLHTIKAALKSTGHSMSVAIETSSLMLTKQLIVSGLGGAILSASSVADQLASKEVALVSLSGCTLRRRAVLAMLPDRRHLRPVDHLFDALAMFCQDASSQETWPGFLPVAAEMHSSTTETPDESVSHP